MSFLIKTHYRLAYDSIAKNRTRSFLTCLGISIGVAAIILILSLMGSINRLISNQVQTIGSDLIVVRPNVKQDEVKSVLDELTSSNQYLKSNLNLTDAESIAKLEEDVAAVAAVARLTGNLSTERVGENDETYTHVVESASLVATTSSLADIHNLKIHSGTFFADKANTDFVPAVIGKNLSLNLFGSTAPVSKTFTYLGARFIIVGLLSETDDPINFSNIDFDNSVLIPIDRAAAFDGSLQIQQINVRSKTSGNLKEVSQKIEEVLKSSKSGDTNFAVLYGDQITHPAGGLFQIVSGMLTLVACVSLVVGGIGVMNIMLVSVAERTHEIGIRKAVGATSSHILIQFLFESLILSSLGGLFGLILGYVLAFLVSIFTPFAPYIDINILGVTLTTSVLIGLIFGLYPAAKAAHKNPIDSLRYLR